MARNYTVQDFALSVDRRGDAAEARDVVGRVIQVVQFPAAAVNVRLKVDEGPYVPVTGPLRLETCGQPYRRITVQNDPSDGTLSVYVGDDPIPSLGSPTVAAEPYVRATWVPLASVVDGGTLPNEYVTRDGLVNRSTWTVSQSGTGLVPVAALRSNRRVGLMRPAGGGSFARFSALSDISWERLATGYKSRPYPSLQAWNIAARIARDGAGGAKTYDHGLMIQGSNGTALSGPASAFFGVVGDGVGGWRFVSFATNGHGGTPTVSVPLSWPAAVTDLVTLRLELVAADGLAGRDGRIRVYLNDSLAYEHTNMAQIHAPNVLHPAAPDTGYGWQFMDAGSDSQRLYFCDVDMWCGPAGMRAP